MKSVLLLSAGRRVSLLRAFEAELRKRDGTAKVFAGDMRPHLSSACASAQAAIELPAVRAAGYVEALLTACRERDIGLVVPTIDTELAVLADAKPLFERHGIVLAVSAPALVKVCRDKRDSDALFRHLGLTTPRIYGTDADIRYPCFGKPLDGSRSIGALVVHDEAEMRLARSRNTNSIFMELVDTRAADEYTVDLYYDRAGALKCLVPRRRIEVRDGEISKGITERNDLAAYLQRHLSRLDGALGCLTLQVFRHRDGGRYWTIELNPRFGGGYPLSHAAGANYPGWLIDEHLGGQAIAVFDTWEEGLLMLRYDAEVFVHAAAN